MEDPVNSQAFGNPWAGPISGLASGVKVIGSIDNGFDPAGFQCRDTRHRRHDDMLDPVQIRRHQFGTKLGRHTVDGPDLGFFLVRPQDQPVAFLTYVPAFFWIADNGQFRQTPGDAVTDRAHGVGHQILVQNRNRGDVEPHHMADFPAPGARGIDDVGGLDPAFLRLDAPSLRPRGGCL